MKRFAKLQQIALIESLKPGISAHMRIGEGVINPAEVSITTMNQ